MAEIVLIEPPSSIQKYLVWLTKGADEDWGTRRKDAGRGRDDRFSPNRACVIVTRSGGQYFSNWMQIREHYYGDPSNPAQEMCSGTEAFEGNSVEYMPQWAIEVRDLAVKAVEEANRG